MRKIYSLLVFILISTFSFSQTLIYHENFEQPSNADSIVSTGNPGWTINTTYAYEGVQSFHTSIALSDTSYAKTNQFSTIGNNFVLFSFAHIAKISFFDVAIVEISFDNINWTHLTVNNTTYTGSTASSFGNATQNKFTAATYPTWTPGVDTLIPNNSWWKVETFDISSLAANQPQVWLRFKSYDLTNNGPAGNYGWLLDDIKVVGYLCDPALTSGTASASNDSICNLDPVTLTLANSHGDIQWLSSIDGGLTWQLETGPGSNSDTLIVNPAQPIQYAAITSLGTCISDTSNILTVHVEQVVSPTTTGASRCGIGNVTLSASGNGTLSWYDAQTGGNLLDTGSTYTPYITGTTTYYVESIIGTASVEDSLQAHPLTGGNGCGGGNMFEVNPAVDLTVNKLSINLTAGAGTIVPVNLYYKTGTFLGSETISADWTLLATVNVTSNGQDIASFMILPSGLALTGGVNYAFFVNADLQYTTLPTPSTYTNSDLTIVTGAGLCSAFGGINNGRAWNGKIHYTKGGGCASPRTPVTATMTNADAITINASSVSLCEGDPTTLTASSANGGYTYTWSPNVNLSSTTGASVVATPLSPITYYVVGNDGNCANHDSIFIDVGPAAVAGVASAPGDTVCTGSSTSLSLSGYQGNIQWYSSNDGISWQPETNPGSTTALYTITPMNDSYYIAIVTSAGCPADTTNTLFITSLSPVAPTTTGATRCGYGSITLDANGVGILDWYNSPTGGNLINSGLTYTTIVNNTTTYYVEAVVGNSGSGSSILITEADLGGTDGLEIMNVSGSPIDVTGWTVAISDSYTNINAVNTTVKTLNGIMNPGDLLHWTDGTINPWGSNMFWNPGAFPTFTGWAIIIDDLGNIVDFMIWEWPDANIQTMSITVAGFPITIGSEWSGNGIASVGATAGLSLSRQGSSDNDDNSDFIIQTSSLGNANPGLNLPFAGGGCSSPRVPVTATVTTPPAMTLTTSADSLCIGDTAVLNVTSSNATYNYSWSPNTGLSSTTGATVSAFPGSTIEYTLIADDGNCGNIDSVTITVSPMTVAGIANGPDTICSGVSAFLSVSGHTGAVQWQSFDGTNWVNETGTGSDSANYQATPSQTTTYQALVQNGVCPAIATNPLTVVVINPLNPVTIGDSRCGPGLVNLSASGIGNFYWYEAPQGGSHVNIGTTYSPNLSQTTTFYVETVIGGDFYSVGPINNGFGNQTSAANSNYGMTFNVTTQATLEKVHVYPWSTGVITVNLRIGTGPVIATVTDSVYAFTGKTEIPLGFPLSPANGYRLELVSNGVLLGRNSSAASYPYTAPGGPLSITGYFNPNPGTAPTDYRYFYDWLVSTGCKSARIPVTGEILGLPAAPLVTQQGNLLVSSSPSNNQWYFQGNPIPGATSQTFAPDSTGPYYVVVDNGACQETSNTIFFIHVSIADPEQISLVIYPNPGSGLFTIEFELQKGRDVEMGIYNVLGELVHSEKVAKGAVKYSGEIDITSQADGLYFLIIKSGEAKYLQKLIISK